MKLTLPTLFAALTAGQLPNECPFNCVTEAMSEPGCLDPTGDFSQLCFCAHEREEMRLYRACMLRDCAADPDRDTITELFDEICHRRGRGSLVDVEEMMGHMKIGETLGRRQYYGASPMFPCHLNVQELTSKRSTSTIRPAAFTYPYAFFIVQLHPSAPP
jgi:hypothetical protein